MFSLHVFFASQALFVEILRKIAETLDVRDIIMLCHCTHQPCYKPALLHGTAVEHVTRGVGWDTLDPEALAALSGLLEQMPCCGFSCQCVLAPAHTHWLEVVVNC